MADTFNKRFSSGEIFTIPYEANKQWDITSSQYPEYNIFFELGIYPTSSKIQNYTKENLLYKSVLANFYPEFYPTSSLTTSSYYQTLNYTSSLTSEDYAVSGALRVGNQATTFKYFPTYTSSYIYTLNIPTSLYSNRILPTTFEMEVSGGIIYDDGEYNLIYSGSEQTSSVGSIVKPGSYVGNIFYEQGLGVLTVIPISIIPPPLPNPPPPPPPPIGQEWVALWLSDPTNSSGATNNFTVRYEYTINGVYNYFDFIQTLSGLGPYSIYSYVVRQDAGSGKWVTISGTPLPQFSQVLSRSGTILATPNLYWEIQAGAEGVRAQRQVAGTSILDNYTNPFGTDPFLPSNLPVDLEIFGTLVQAMTYKRGVIFTRES
jgi:hypothetical protein